MKALRQDVAEEAADELIGCKGHELVSCAAAGAIVLVPEGDAVLVERNQPAVGDIRDLQSGTDHASRALGRRLGPSRLTLGISDLKLPASALRPGRLRFGRIDEALARRKRHCCKGLRSTVVRAK